MNKNILIALVIALILIGGVSYWTKTKTAALYTPKVENLVKGPIVGYIKSPIYAKYLTDKDGRTLYIYAGDRKLESVCVKNPECSKMWFPFIFDFQKVTSFDDDLSKKVNVIPENESAWATYAYGESPLYYYIGDENPGDVNGNGLENG